MTREAVISVEGIDVSIARRRGSPAEILHGVSFALLEGEMHGLVGETGSGKSITARAVMGLLPRGGSVTDGRIVVAGTDIVGLDEKQMGAIRGSTIGMVFQSPRAALYPLHTVRTQMFAVLRAHQKVSSAEGRQRIRNALRTVGIRDPDRVGAAYPHELSGGMAQRVVIATVLISEPKVVIADEPTTGLDATVQRQILELLAGLQHRLGLSVMMITHDLAIVAQYCHTVSVMYEGRVVEEGPTRRVLASAEHGYTRRLLEASKLSGVNEARQAVAYADR